MNRVISYHVFGYESILGPVGAAGGKLLIGYLLFGATLLATGAGKLMMDLALCLFGRFRGGPAKVSNLASMVYGMFSPSSIATVMTNGPMTIPAMRKAGYPALYAAAVETCSSVGGAFMPPIMGASAFVMAALLGIPYWTVAVAAFTPSILYYIILFTQADAYAARVGIRGLKREELPSFRHTLSLMWPFGIPVAILIWFLIQGQEAQSPFYASAAVLACSMIRKETRPSLKGLWQSLESALGDMAEPLRAAVHHRRSCRRPDTDRRDHHAGVPPG